MILIHILVGGICTGILSYLYRISINKNIKVKIWQWILVFLEVALIGFVLELIAGFIEEGSIKAAVVMGSIFTVLAIIGMVLILRFIFRTAQDKINSNPEAL